MCGGGVCLVTILVGPSAQCLAPEGVALEMPDEKVLADKGAVALVAAENTVDVVVELVPEKMVGARVALVATGSVTSISLLRIGLLAGHAGRDACPWCVGRGSARSGVADRAGDKRDGWRASRANQTPKEGVSDGGEMTSSRVWGLCRGPGGDAGEGWRVMVKRERGGKQTGTDWIIGVGVKVSGSEQGCGRMMGVGSERMGPKQTDESARRGSKGGCRLTVTSSHQYRTAVGPSCPQNEWTRMCLGVGGAKQSKARGSAQNSVGVGDKWLWFC